jgi:hypothetical protein
MEKGSSSKELINIRHKISFGEIKHEITKDLSGSILKKRQFLAAGEVNSEKLHCIASFYRRMYIDTFSSKNSVFKRMYGKDNKF